MPADKGGIHRPEKRESLIWTPEMNIRAAWDHDLLVMLETGDEVFMIRIYP